jgi:osmotically inducible protein OsmC
MLFDGTLSPAHERRHAAPEKVATSATVTLEKTDAGFTITNVHLDVVARVPLATQESFDAAANNAKVGCPISRLLNTEITMSARLEGE